MSFTYDTVWRLFCNAIDCRRTLQVVNIGNIYGVRKEAEFSNWTHKDGKDYCPEHSKGDGDGRH